MRIVMESEKTLQAINRQSLLAGRLCGNGHNAFQMFNVAAMDLPPPVTPKSFKKHEVSLP